MSKLHKRFLSFIFVLTISVCLALYAEPSFYHLFAIVLGILVGPFFFFRIPRAILDKWLVSDEVRAGHLISVLLVGFCLMVWPLALVMYIGDLAFILFYSNIIFLHMIFWTIVILRFLYTFD